MPKQSLSRMSFTVSIKPEQILMFLYLFFPFHPHHASKEKSSGQTVEETGQEQGDHRVRR